MLTLSRKKKPFDGAYDYEENAAGSVSPVDAKSIHELIKLLTGTLSGEQIKTQEVLAVLPNWKVMSGDGLVPEGQRDALKQTLFQEIKQHSKPFKLVSSEPGKTVYADPNDPGNISKQITCIWDKEKNDWHYIPGENANAIIPDEASGRLIEICNGQVLVHNNRKAAPVPQMKPELSEEKAADVLQQKVRGSLEGRLGSNLLHFAAINAGETGHITKLAGKIENTLCDFTRDNKYMNPLRNSLTRLLDPVVFSAPYQMGEFEYYWFQSGENLVGVKLDKQNNISLLLPDNYQGSELCMMLSRGWLPGNMADGRPHAGTGFSGSHVAIIGKDGASTLWNNGEKHPNTAHLVPQNPRVVGVVKLSEQEIGEHHKRAVQAGVIFEKDQSLAVFTEEMPLSETQYQPAKPEKIVLGAMTSKILAEKPEPKGMALPLNIKVTGIDGASVFELHCAFREIANEDGTKGCQSEDFGRYTGNVYILKKIGSSISNDGNPDGLIVEVSEEGHVRLRSGITGAGVPFRAVEAKVTVTKDGKEYRAILGMENGTFSQDFGESIEETPFRMPAQETFMCIDGCCGHYTAENQSLIKNPQPVLGATK